MNAKTWIIVGALIGGLSVTLGAFGAHGLTTALESWIADEALREKRLGDWETAARYQMYHALALLAVGLLARHWPQKMLDAAGLCFLAGPLIFSGCLYGLVLSYAVAPAGYTWLGAVVPVGGGLMILGWVLLAVGAWRGVSSRVE